MTPERCEFPGKSCLSHKTRLYQGVNSNQEKFVVWLCNPHSVQVMNFGWKMNMMGKLDQTQAALADMGNKMTPEQLRSAPEHKAKLAHALGCPQCAAVDMWIQDRVADGSTGTVDGIKRVGTFIIQHKCAIGKQLEENMGRAMLGLPPQPMKL